MGRKEENRIGVLGATSYIVGSIIGSGIFVAPKGILFYAGSVGLSLIIWVVCALMAMLTAINYIELGTSIPESGIEISYLSYVGWYPIAFSFLWLSTLIVSTCSGSILLLTFGQYIIEAIKPIKELPTDNKELAIQFFGFGLLFFLAAVNMYSLKKFASKIQIVSMFAKMLAIIMIIGIGAYFMIFKGDVQYFKKDYILKNSQWGPAKIVHAIYQGNWAYAGYTTLNYGIEDVEIKNFKKTLPRAVIGGLAISSIVYVLANIAYFSVLTPQDIMDSDAVATSFLQATLGQNASYVMPLLVGLLLIGTLNGAVFSWSRYMLAGARRGMMPTIWSLIHPTNDSPRVAVLSYCILCVGMSFVGDVQTLVNYLTVTQIMVVMFALAALIYIKWSKVPVAKEAVKFHIIWPIINLLIQLALLIIPCIDDPVTSAVGFGAFLIGLAAYFIFVWPERKLWILVKLDEYSTFVCQLLFWTVVDRGPEYEKESNEHSSLRKKTLSPSVATIESSNAVRRTSISSISSSIHRRESNFTRF